jgi:hypothetical protein
MRVNSESLSNEIGEREITFEKHFEQGLAHDEEL